MRRGDPNIRRALVTRLSEDGSRAWVLVEWMRAQRLRDEGAIQDVSPKQNLGIEAVAQTGVELGDEVLVDLRPLPVSWLSFLFFGVPLLLFVAAAFLGQVVGSRWDLHPGGTLLIQMGLGLVGVGLAYSYANRVQQQLRDQGLGTPVITAIMPRFHGQGTDTLHALFRLANPVADSLWSFASEELSRITGVLDAQLREDRVEVVFRKDVIKEKHLLELLVLLGFPIVVERDLG